MKGILDDLLNHFRKHSVDLPDHVVKGFLRVLETARVQQMPCAEVFAQLDQYVEKKVRGQDAEKLMPLLREHLEICPDCCEEYRALLRALKESTQDEVGDNLASPA